MISIICPTRGMIFTETDIALDEIRNYFDCKVFRTFDKPIPDAQNFLVDEALKTDCEFLFFVEEDVVVPFDIFSKLVNCNADISFADYGVAGWSCSMYDNLKKQYLWCGLGATLVKRKVFEKLEKPYFRTDKSLRLNDMEWIDSKMKYGGHDIYFFTKAHEAGFKIMKVEGECRHLQIDSLGKREINNGLHILSNRDKISKVQVIN